MFCECPGTITYEDILPIINFTRCQLSIEHNVTTIPNPNTKDTNYPPKADLIHKLIFLHNAIFDYPVIVDYRFAELFFANSMNLSVDKLMALVNNNTKFNPSQLKASIFDNSFNFYELELLKVVYSDSILRRECAEDLAELIAKVRNKQ